MARQLDILVRRTIGDRRFNQALPTLYTLQTLLPHGQDAHRMAHAGGRSSEGQSLPPEIGLLLTGPRFAAALDPIDKPGCLLAQKHSADILARHTRRALGVELVTLGERGVRMNPVERRTHAGTNERRPSTIATSIGSDRR
jgi:hypothetical protein